MTRTEDRLTDALHTAARSVREETLRPLEAPAPTHRRWALRLAPAAAAACVALAIVVVAVVVPMLGRTPSNQTGSPAGPPPFYAVVMVTSIQVHSTATGAVTGTVPSPFYGHGRDRPRMLAAGVTAVGSGDREFIAAFEVQGDITRLGGATLYSFRVNGQGHVTDISLISGGTLNGFNIQGMAASPDGSKLALLACKFRHPSADCQNGVVVIDLRTGARTVWTDGLRWGTTIVGIAEVGWAPDGGSVTFLAEPCVPTTAECAPGRAPQPQLREISLSTGGGSLARSSVLFTGSARYPYLRQALLTNGGRTITLLYLYGPMKYGTPENADVVQVPVAGGGPPRLLYRGLKFTPGNMNIYLQLSASGRYLLITGGPGLSWVYHGKLHSLPGQFSDFSAAW